MKKIFKPSQSKCQVGKRSSPSLCAMLYNTADQRLALAIHVVILSYTTPGRFFLKLCFTWFSMNMGYIKGSRVVDP